MIMDYDQELTVAGGHAINGLAGTAYGARPYDRQAAGASSLKAGGDDAIGEKLTVYMQTLGVDTGAARDVTVTLITDTDGAGAGAVALVAKLFAAPTVAQGVQRVGVVPSGTAMLRYLTARILTSGDPATATLIKVWFTKGDDLSPQNNGVDIA